VRGLPVVLLVTLVALVVAGGVFLIIRARLPLFALPETDDSRTAIEHWQAGNFTETVRSATDQLEQFPVDGTALALRGFSRFYLSLDAVEQDVRFELLEGATRDLRRALLAPDQGLRAEAHYVLGKTFFHRGAYFYRSAIRELETAQELGISRLDLFEYLALASRDIGATDDAIGYFRETIERSDEAVHRLALAEILMGQERFGEADELLVAVIDGTADVTLLQDALLTQGLSFRMQERIGEAISVYNELLEINPSSADARYGLGEAYLSQGENELARFEWREAVRLNPNHIESLQRLQEY
jgi:tetratricopeptide (TPR) repeat protein